MSTRTRILLKRNNQVVSYGRRAKVDVGLLVGKKSKNVKALAEKLPVGFSLVLVKEPKHTRKSRSLYRAMKQGQVNI